MQREIDEEAPRNVGGGLVTSWVMTAMLLIATTFFAQFPETPDRGRTVAAAD